MSAIRNDGVLRQREPRVRDKAYLEWLHQGIRCVSCAIHGRRRDGEHAAHIKIGFPEAGWRAFGHSEKSHDRRAVPLCVFCHMYGPQAQHSNRGGDERAWWKRLGVYPPTFCAALNEAFDTGAEPDEVIVRAALGEFPFPEAS